MTGWEHMNMKSSFRATFILTISLLGMSVFAGGSKRSSDEKYVVNVVKQAATYIHQHGKHKAINELRTHSNPIFAIEYNGTVLASPIHPETVGTNQIDFRDPSGVFVVREEVEKAKDGGGWLKGRYRKNHKTGHYECRRLYIFPMKGGYFIGSWYYYHADANSTCPI
jgi:hypothetical protein